MSLDERVQFVDTGESVRRCVVLPGNIEQMVNSEARLTGVSANQRIVDVLADYYGKLANENALQPANPK